MKLRCIHTSGEYINEKTKKEGHFSQNTDASYWIKAGNEYFVYGIALGHNGGLMYLIVSDGGNHHWAPTEFFEVVDSLLPIEQYFTLRESHEQMKPQALWGYKELIEKQDHYQGLWLSEKEDTEIFWLAKKRIDKDNMYDIPPEKDVFTDWVKGKPIE